MKHLRLISLALVLLSPALAGAKCVSGNCANGSGTYTWPDGSTYVGQFRNSRLHGQGTYSWPDGSVYSGQFADNKSSGQGTYTWPDGRV